MTMLEKMASAWQGIVPFMESPPRDVLLDALREALLVIREPTEGMVEAAHRADPLGCDVEHAGDVYPPSWRAMIDAILNEPDQPQPEDRGLKIAVLGDSFGPLPFG